MRPAGTLAPERERLTVAPRAAARDTVHAWPLAIAGLLVGAFLLRLPYFDVPLSADEGGYATAAYWWARGDTLYRNITITRPQGIFVAFRLIEALGLGSPRGIHLVAAAWVALATVALLGLATRVWGRGVGFAAAALYAVVMATPALEGYQANAELFMTPPLLCGLWLLLCADDSSFADRRGLLLLAGSGVLGAVALLLKPSAVALLPLAALWVLRRCRLERAPWRACLLALGALALGWLAGLLPALAHGLLTAPERYLRAVLFYRIEQDSVVGGAVAHQLDYLWRNSLVVALSTPLLLALGGYRLAAHDGDRRGRDLLALWTLTALGGTALGGNWFLHYYQQLLPPLAVAAALAARLLLRRPLTPPRFAGLCLAAVFALPSLWFVGHALVAGIDATKLPEWEPGVAAAPPVAAYLAAHTAPDERVYVAYDHADIYYLAGRRPAARWLHFRELRGTPGAFAEQTELIADPATAPRYIVGAQAFDRWDLDADGTLRALVARDYRLETTIGGMDLYRRVAQP